MSTSQSGLVSAQELLTPLVALLDAFNRHYKNQHRRSAWWCRFDRMRRELRKLQLDLSDEITKKRGDRISQRARWMTEAVAPSSYFAFTQLAADNQFAALGITLLAVLARAKQVLDLVLGSTPALPQQIEGNTDGLDLGVAVERTAPVLHKTHEGVPLPAVATPAQDRTQLICTPNLQKQPMGTGNSSSTEVGRVKKRSKSRADFSALFSSVNT